MGKLTHDGWTLSDEARHMARQLRGQAEDYQWTIGDFLNDQWNAAPKRHRLSVINILSSDMGIGKSTGRLYRRVSSTFPPGARDVFEEGIATWGHARIAVTAKDPIGAVLWVATSADERGGTPATVDQLAVHVREMRAPKQLTRREKVSALLERAHRDLVAAFNLAYGAPKQSEAGRRFATQLRELASESESLLARLKG